MGEWDNIVYLSGPITGVPDYWKAFEQAEEELNARRCLVLNPAHLPEGMSTRQYMHVDFAMVDIADIVVMLPGWENSKGAKLERDYCIYTDKPVIELEDFIVQLDYREVVSAR